MITRKDIPRLLSAGLRTEFMKGYGEPTTVYQDLCIEIPSNSDSEDYAWLGETNGLKEWKDERIPHGLLENGFSLRNKDYEDTIEVDRNALDDEKYGQIKIRIKNMGITGKQSYDELLAEKIEENGICYDGQNFFDTDHEEGESGVQLNVQTTGYALSADKLKLIITAMKKLVMSNGKRAKIKPSHLVVPTDLEWTAQELMDPKVVQVTTDPAKALLKDKLKIIIMDDLANDGANSKYYVLDLVSRAVKPFIFQNRKPITFAAQDDPSSPELFMRKKIYYGIDARFAFGYGDWRQAYRAEG